MKTFVCARGHNAKWKSMVRVSLDFMAEDNRKRLARIEQTRLCLGHAEELIRKMKGQVGDQLHFEEQGAER